MIVVDTNIIYSYWLASPASAQAEELEKRDADWVVPPLWRSEFRNAVSLSVRHRVIALRDAIELVERAEARLRNRELEVSSRTVMELVGLSSCTAYDCEFVAIGREHGLRLVTLDKQVLREFPHIAVSLSDFLAS